MGFSHPETGGFEAELEPVAQFNDAEWYVTLALFEILGKAAQHSLIICPEISSE